MRYSLRDRPMLGAAIASEVMCLVGMVAWVIGRPALSAPFTLVVPFGFATVSACAVAICIARLMEGKMSHFDE